MHRHRTPLGLVTLTVGMLLSACNLTDGPLVHHMDVAVTAETRTITDGKLTATLFGYDPNIADKPADTLDVQDLTLQHQQGTQTAKAVMLSAEIPEGFEAYVSVEGYERRNGVWERILWDGLEGTGMPTQVEMQLLPEETPEGQRLEESLTDWQVLKEQNGGDYQYDVVFGSWTGYTTTTTLEVQDDNVVLRRFEARDAEGTVTESWTENRHGARLARKRRTAKDQRGFVRDMS